MPFDIPGPPPYRKPVVRPFSPDDVLRARIEQIPDFVIEAVNELLIEKYTGSLVIIYQEDIVDRAQAKMRLINNKLDPEHKLQWSTAWLNFEPLYETFGWKVTYDKPAYNESYRPHFSFKPISEPEKK